MAAHLDRIEAVNGKVNAIVALQDRGGLLKQAAERDADLAAGRPVGTLHGLPHAVKDLTPVKGLPQSNGSPIFKGYIAPSDSLDVARLRKAGVVIVGKTNTPEFGLGSHTYNPVYGATGNAFDPRVSAGGSSGGAAVSLALGMTPLADGSDYGGSLRNPAGWNNVYGFRTSIGRVPLPGRDVWLPSMAVKGPMARNVADLALLLSVQAGYDPGAPLSMPGAGEPFAVLRPEAVKGRRIAWLGDLNGALPYDPGVLDVCRDALKTFGDLGCPVEEAAPDYPVEKVWQAFVKLRNWQTASGLIDFYRDPAKRALIKPEAVYEIEGGLQLSALEISDYSAVRTAWSEAVRHMFDRYDYLIMPTAQVFPFPVEETWPREVAGRTMRTYHEWMESVCLITMAGCPSLAAPAGFSPTGAPMGIQIIAPVHHEADCLQLALAYEAAAQPRLKRRSPLLDA